MTSLLRAIRTAALVALALGLAIPAVGDPGADASAPAEPLPLSSLAPEAPAAPTHPAQPDPFRQMLPRFGHGLFARAGAEAVPVEAAPVPPTYTLGPGDLLRVELWTSQVQQVAEEAPLDADGAVVLPDVGRVPLQGLSLAAARGLLQQRYAQLYRSFELQVTVSQLRVTEVFVIGEVTRPGKFHLPGNATVFTALYAAGGPNENGTLRALRLNRADQTLQTVDLYDYLLRGERVADLPLQPGDTVFVPLAGPRVGVAGAVHRPAQFELRGEQTLAEALAMAGGLRPEAYAARVQVRRWRDFAQYETLEVDLGQPGAAEGFPLRDGDRIVAERQVEELQNAVYIEGEVYRPGVYELREGLTLGQLLRQAQGLTPQAYGEWGALERLSAQGRYETRSLRPRAAYEGEVEHELPLQARDRIVIYAREQVEGRPAVTVLGEVRNPGELDYLPGMSLQDALRQAGGLLPGAFTEQAQLLRVGPDMGEAVHTVNLQLALAGEPAHNLPLEPHDRLVVRSREQSGALPTVTIEGQVRHPGVYRRYQGLRVSDLIALAGGLLPGASGELRVTHGHYTDRPEQQSVLVAGAGGGAPDPDLELRDDDHIAVMAAGGFIEKPAAVLVMGQVAQPGPYVLEHPAARPEGVWDLLQRAGGLRPEGYGPGVVVYRRADSLMSPEQRREFEILVSALDAQQRELRGQDFRLAPELPAPPVAPPSGSAEAPAGQRPIAEASADPPAGGAGGTAPATPNEQPPPATSASPDAVITPEMRRELQQTVTQGLAEALVVRDAVTILVPPRLLMQAPLGQALAVDWEQMTASGGQRGDVQLQAGDVIHVPARPTVVLVAGAVQRQGPVRFEPGLTVAEAIRQAGGLGKDSASNRTVVIQLNGRIAPRAAGEVLEPGDVVVVPTEYIVRTVRTESAFERIMSTIADVVTSFLLVFRL